MDEATGCFDCSSDNYRLSCPSSSHEDAVALEILQLVISGGESSRLPREVVRKEVVAVMAGGINHLLKRAGMSMFFAAFTRI
jgi:predicted Zn-dependent peptidase